MPVTIPEAHVFDAVFSFLRHGSDAGRLLLNNTELDCAQRGTEVWGTPFYQFERGIVYSDGRVDLCKTALGPTHIDALLDALERNEHISQFLLGNNVISTTGTLRIAAYINSYPERIETWYLAGCHITAAPFGALAAAMAKSSRLTNVWLKRNPLGPEAVPSLVHLIVTAPNLRTVDLENTELGDAGVARLFDELQGKPSSLRNIYLNACGIGANACRALGGYLDSPPTHIESLFLASNPIGDAGMAQLAPAVGRHACLKRITFASNGLTPVGISQLCAALKAHPKLVSVDLGAAQTSRARAQRFNYIDGTAVSALHDLMQAPMLRALSLNRTALTSVELARLKRHVADSQLVSFECFSIHKQQHADEDVNALMQRQLVANRKRYFPAVADPAAFESSEACRFLRNTEDVRLIDSQYRTLDKKGRMRPSPVWDEGGETWRVVVSDAQRWRGVGLDDKQ